MNPELLSFKNERAFNESVRQVFRDLAPLGVAGYHSWRSDKSVKGFPDWICLVKSRGWALELKTGKYKPTPNQLRWLDAFGRLPNWKAQVVYPADWPAVRDEIIAVALGKKGDPDAV